MRPGLPNVIEGYVMNENGTRSTIFIDSEQWEEWLEDIKNTKGNMPGFFYEDLVDERKIQLTIRYHKDLGTWKAHGRGPFVFAGSLSKVNYSSLRHASLLVGEEVKP